jgi:hypothetical protein
MKNYLVSLLIASAFSTPALSNEIIVYPEANRIPNEQVSAYREAIISDLTIQGKYTSCFEIPVLLSVTHEIRSAPTKWYLFRGNQPLLVLQINTTVISSPTFADFYELRFTTNAEMTQITAVDKLAYNILTDRVNVGTLADPKMVTNNWAKLLKQETCFKK